LETQHLFDNGNSSELSASSSTSIGVLVMLLLNASLKVSASTDDNKFCRSSSERNGNALNQGSRKAILLSSINTDHV